MMQRLRLNSRGLEFGFAWIFAIMVGAMVLFLAIYATTNFIQSSRFESDSKVAAQLGIILNPVETNLESGKYSKIGFPDRTRVYNFCREAGNFGRQGIKTSVRSNIGKEWEDPGAESTFFNKYVFSNDIEEGEVMHVLVKGFEMPFKIGDLIFMSADSYCFVNPPSEIKNEVGDLGVENIDIVETGRASDCHSRSKSVCFGGGGSGCDISVQGQSVRKKDGVVFYEGALIYGAIFADSEIYECQVKRLMKRRAELAQLYASKTGFLSAQGCSSNLYDQLIGFGGIEFESSRDLSRVAFSSEEIRRKNELLSCRLF
jgi:hypothetical protein